MRVPDSLLDCVGFIGLFNGTNPEFVGTFFLTLVKGSGRWNHLYLVTAKHIAERCDGGNFFVSINDRQGQSLNIQSDDRAPWTTHPTDEAVDVAVLPFNVDSAINRINPRVIDRSMYASKERLAKLNIGVGDEVFMTGLFKRASGKEINIPIVRMGNVASIPREKISFGGKEIDAYLIEARSISGLSGSPVFVRETISVPLTNEQTGGNERSQEDRPTSFIGHGSFYFMGLNIGHWAVDERKGAREEEQVNMGISVVVPCEKIIEVLDHPVLLENRRKAAEDDRKNDGAVLD